MSRRPLLDTRPDWRDPDLPCIRNYRMPNGTLRTEVDPDYESRYRAHMIEAAEQPDWRRDPTYNLNRKATK